MVMVAILASVTTLAVADNGESIPGSTANFRFGSGAVAGGGFDLTVQPTRLTSDFSVTAVSTGSSFGASSIGAGSVTGSLETIGSDSTGGENGGFTASEGTVTGSSSTGGLTTTSLGGYTGNGGITGTNANVSQGSGVYGTGTGAGYTNIDISLDMSTWSPEDISEISFPYGGDITIDSYNDNTIVTNNTVTIDIKANGPGDDANIIE